MVAAVLAQVFEDKADTAIYVVDFDPASRAEVTAALSGLPWPVHSYETPGALLAAMPQAASGCVVANVHLAEMTVEQFLKALEHDRQRTALILLSGDMEIPEAVAAIRAGVHDVLQLPVVERLLRRQVKAAIASTASFR